MSKFIARTLSVELQTSAREYPVVTLVGPRQSGKTTLVRALFPSYAYANLENPELSDLAKSDPKAFLNRYAPPVILDEIQRAPDLLSWIQTQADDDRHAKGKWILTGSNHLLLRETVSQSLTGRTALLTLLPLSLSELGSRAAPSWTEILHAGFLPCVYDQGIRPLSAWRDYFQTYVERDVRQITAIDNQAGFERFLRLLAGRVGQLLNLNSLSGDVGVSHPTLAKWLSVLEASFLVFRLPPYHRNFGKRITKSPKIYFTDPGLAAFLLGIKNPDQVERDPLAGNLFENLVVVEALKSRLHKGLPPNLYFFRDHNGNEIDLLYPDGNDATPIEIKSAMTFTQSFEKGIAYFHKIANSAKKGRIIYSGDFEFSSDQYDVVNFKNAFP